MASFISIGRSKKSYGVKGDLKVSVEAPYGEDFQTANVLFFELKGQKVPYFIEKIGTSPDLWVKLEEVDSKEAALVLSNKELFLRKQDIKHSEETETNDFTILSGFVLVDQQEGVIGPIEEVLSMPQQTMAVVRFQEKELFIPLNDQFIQEIDTDSRKIIVDLPEGLLEL